MCKPISILPIRLSRLSLMIVQLVVDFFFFLFFGIENLRRNIVRYLITMRNSTPDLPSFNIHHKFIHPLLWPGKFPNKKPNNYIVQVVVVFFIGKTKTTTPPALAPTDIES